MTGGLPDAEEVHTALRRYTRNKGLTLVIGLGLSAGAVIGDALVRTEAPHMVLIGFLLVGLVTTGYGVAGLIRALRMAALARDIPWRLFEFAYAETAGMQGSGTGLIFLREPETSSERVLRVVGLNRGTELSQVTDLTIPLCGDSVEGGIVYVPHARRLLWIRPFLDPESAQAAVRGLMSQGRMGLGEREYQESFRKPLKRQRDTWTVPAKRGFTTYGLYETPETRRGRG